MTYKGRPLQGRGFTSAHFFVRKIRLLRSHYHSPSLILDFSLLTPAFILILIVIGIGVEIGIGIVIGIEIGIGFGVEIEIGIGIEIGVEIGIGIEIEIGILRPLDSAKSFLESESQSE